MSAALGMARELRHRIADTRDLADGMIARRPSPSGMVIPEVDAMGRLLDLYLAPGTCDRFGNQELAAEIVAAIRESADDARRRYNVTMNEPDRLPRPFSEVMRDWRAGAGDRPRVPNFGKPGE
ncbi:hypothetical protein AB0M34_10195 [Nocardia sp. NPDC050193]